MAKERIYTSCKRCAGSGIAVPGGLSPVENPCSECGGAGQVPGVDTVELSGADDQAEAAIAALDVKVDAVSDNIDAIAERVGLMDGKIDEILKIVSKEK